MYANAGGVTVSYFEWVRNLSHIRFGRMQRRQEEYKANLLLEELQRQGFNFPSAFESQFTTGSDELALVRSGLDDTMRDAYDRMRTTWWEDDNVTDLRMAAYTVAITDIANSYSALGL